MIIIYNVGKAEDIVTGGREGHQIIEHYFTQNSGQVYLVISL